MDLFSLFSYLTVIIVLTTILYLHIKLLSTIIMLVIIMIFYGEMILLKRLLTFRIFHLDNFILIGKYLLK